MSFYLILWLATRFLPQSHRTRQKTERPIQHSWSWKGIRLSWDPRASCPWLWSWCPVGPRQAKCSGLSEWQGWEGRPRFGRRARGTAAPWSKQRPWPRTGRWRSGRHWPIPWCPRCLSGPRGLCWMGGTRTVATRKGSRMTGKGLPGALAEGLSCRWRSRSGCLGVVWRRALGRVCWRSLFGWRTEEFFICWGSSWGNGFLWALIMGFVWYGRFFFLWELYRACGKMKSKKSAINFKKFQIYFWKLL